MSKTFPIEITVRNIESTPAIEARIREKAEKLSLFNDRIMSCKVVVDMVQKHKTQGKLYNVTIDTHIPGKTIVATHNPNEDLYVAIRDAFNAMTRQLEDKARMVRGDVKTHEGPLFGKIARLFTDYGFIESLTGEEYYFSESNLVNTPFAELQAGMDVEFVEAIAGDSLQANHIKVKG
jgi:ribosomal subunit interface protein